MKMNITDPALAKSHELAAIAQAETRKIRLRINAPEFQFEDTFTFSSDDLVWTVKQNTLTSLSREPSDAMNYGLYAPPARDRAGKFLDEERPLKDYPLEGPIATLEFRYKRRVFKSTEADSVKLKKINIPQNMKIFLDCVRKADVDKITKWTSKGLDPNFNSLEKGESPMTVAATLQRPRTVMMALISGGAYLDYRNRDGLTPIHAAAKEGNKEAVRTLLDLGSSPNYKDKSGLTALYYCVTNNADAQCLQMLLHERAEICVKDDKGFTEVHHACLLGLASHLEDLLFYGADMNAQNNNGDTPLHVCAKNNKEECARTLLFRGADTTLRNNGQHTADEVASLAGNKDMVNVIKNFDPSRIVLYKELPKYNEKRRGSISMATIRNLQRSRSNPQLHELFYDNNNWTSSLSPASAKQLLGNLEGVSGGSKYGTGRIDMSPPRRTTQEIFSSANRNSEVPNGSAGPPKGSQWEEKILTINKGNASFGFVLRGPSFNTDGSYAQFSPTTEMPARQYIETVEPGSASDRAGLKDGDFILEINGEDVICATHNHCVSLLKSTTGPLKMKIWRKKTDGLFRANPVLTTNRTKSQMDGLAELERLDETLDNYDHVSLPHEQVVQSENGTRSSYYATEAAKVSNGAGSSYKNAENDAKSSQVHMFLPPGFQDDTPLPDYDEIDENSNYVNDDSTAVDATVNDDIPKRPSTLELSLQQAVRDRESRQLSGVNVQTMNKSSSSKSPSIPVPPPPPPLLLPTPSDSLPELSSNAGNRTSVPPHVKQQLEEAKKRDEGHAALMAAVRQRRQNVDNPDNDGDGIDNKINRTKKYQVVYDAGENGRKENRNSLDSLSALPTQTTNRTLSKSTNEINYESNYSNDYSNGSSSMDYTRSLSSGTPAADGGFMSEAERVRQLYVQQKMATLPRNSKPVASSGVPDISVSKVETVEKYGNTESAAARDSVDHSARLSTSMARSPVSPTAEQPALANIAQIVAQKALERQKNDNIKTEPDKLVGSSKVYTTRTDPVKNNNAAKNPVKPLVINSTASSSNGSSYIGLPKNEPASGVQSKPAAGFSTSYSASYVRNPAEDNQPKSPKSPPRKYEPKTNANTMYNKANANTFANKTSNTNTPSNKTSNANTFQLNSSPFRPADFPSSTSMSTSEDNADTAKSWQKNAGTANDNRFGNNSTAVGTYQRKSTIDTGRQVNGTSANASTRKDSASSVIASMQNQSNTLSRGNAKSYAANSTSNSNYSQKNGKPEAPTRKSSQLTRSDSFIPPPEEFASPSEPAEFITATLRKVDNRQGQSNSMVFRASGNTAGGLSGNSSIQTNGFSSSNSLKPFQTKKIETWTPADVGDWLESLNYDEYVKIFAERNITGPMLIRASQNQSELSSYGVLNVLHKIKLEREIKKFVVK